MANDNVRPLIVDTDLTFYGDDSAALLMALASGLFDIRGITAASGNVWWPDAVRDARLLLSEVAHARIPVIPGVPIETHASRLEFYRTVERASRDAGRYAGALAGVLPEQGAEPGAEPEIDAAGFIIQEAMRSETRPSLLMLGPMTNLAAALERFPDLPDHIDEVFAYGGAMNVPGNVSEHAEFNLWFDPESADRVLRSPLRITLMPLDATSSIFYPPDFPARLRRRPSDAAIHVADGIDSYMERRGGRLNPVWDEMLVGAMIEPGIIEHVEHHDFGVACGRDARYGALLSRMGERSVRTILRVDGDAFFDLLSNTLSTGEIR